MLRRAVGARTMNGHAEALAQQARLLVASHPAAAGFLTGWPAPEATRRTEPCSLPVLRWMPELAPLAAPAASPIVHAILEAYTHLQWRQTYGPADFGAAFLQRYAWTELLGMRGPIASDEVACGFLVLAPWTLYPSHTHEAEEIYLPLAGTALWKKGGEDFIERPSGCLIHHPSWVPHAMQTGTEPLLALYVWRGGDLAAKSRIAAPPDGAEAEMAAPA